MLVLLIFGLLSCKREQIKEKIIEAPDVDCTLEMLNTEIDQMSNEEILLDSIFHLSKDQIKVITASIPLNREERDSIMRRFIARLNDEQILETDCMPENLLPLKVGDLAFYCLAKIERFPFALATGRQNCTEPNISDKMTIPTNFVSYTQWERERLTYRYLEYFDSEERDHLIKEEGYD